MQLRLHPIYRFATVLMFGVFASSAASAQDLLANQAPIDKKMRAIDSLSLCRLVHNEENEMPAFSLYNEWNNQHVASYRNISLPTEFRIDLRHFVMPTKSTQVTSNYGYRRSFRRMHKGIDLKVYTGDTIVSAFAGKVRMVAYEGKGYGKYIVIRHPNGLETVYGHLSKQLVVENQIVEAGQVIGLGGNTGRSTGSHLHFETRLLGDDIDPALLFDFENQDVHGDYYIYKGHNRGYCTNAPNGETRNDLANRGEQEEWTQTDEERIENKKLSEKSSASQQFQQERRAKATRIHKVRSGETLYSIARKNNTTVARLCNANGLTVRSKLRLGQIIRIN